MFILQKEVHDLEIQLTAITTSEQYYSKEVKDLKTELENEKYVFHLSKNSLCTQFLSFLVINNNLYLIFI